MNKDSLVRRTSLYLALRCENVYREFFCRLTAILHAHYFVVESEYVNQLAQTCHNKVISWRFVINLLALWLRKKRVAAYRCSESFCYIASFESPKMWTPWIRGRNNADGLVYSALRGLLRSGVIWVAVKRLQLGLRVILSVLYLHRQ